MKKKRGRSFQDSLNKLKKVAQRSRSDDHCPCCGEDIGGYGGVDLEFLFDGKKFMAGQKLKVKWICPKCFEFVTVEIDVSFTIKEA